MKIIPEVGTKARENFDSAMTALAIGIAGAIFTMFIFTGFGG